MPAMLGSLAQQAFDIPSQTHFLQTYTVTNVQMDQVAHMHAHDTLISNSMHAWI